MAPSPLCTRLSMYNFATLFYSVNFFCVTLILLETFSSLLLNIMSSVTYFIYQCSWYIKQVIAISKLLSDLQTIHVILITNLKILGVYTVLTLVVDT